MVTRFPASRKVRAACGAAIGLSYSSLCFAAVQHVDQATLQAINESMNLAASAVLPLEFRQGPGQAIQCDIELDGVAETLWLFPASVRSPQLQVLAQQPDGSLIPVQVGPPRTIHGTVSNRLNTTVVGSNLDDGLHVTVILENGERWWIEPLSSRMPGLNPDLHVIYRGSDVIPNGGMCGTENPKGPVGIGIKDDLGQVQVGTDGSGGGIAGTLPCVTQLACDADFEYFQAWGSVQATLDRIELVITTMNPQYVNQCGISHLLTLLVVRASEPDPYTQTNAHLLLCEFVTHWTNFQILMPRDVAMLFTGKEIDGSIIGIATNFGEICDIAGFCSANPPDLDDGSYCIAQIDCCASLACATDLAAHELGHLWGAVHCNCPNNTMHPFITCTNNFSAGSIAEITAHRDAVAATCLNCNGNTPPQDDCANAIVVAPGNFYFSTLGATTDGPDEPNACNFFNYTQVGADVWFRYTAPCTGNTTLNLCDATYDTKVAVYLGGCPGGPGTAIACNDDACNGTRSLLTFGSIAGQQYRIRVGGYQSLTGTGIMNISCAIPDGCPDAVQIGNGTYSINTVGATTDGPDEPNACNFFGYTQVGSDIWFRYDASCSGLVTVDLCAASYDTKVAVYAGADCPASPGTAIACNDDACGTSGLRSLVSFPAVGGSAYLIRVGGFQGATGNATMVVSCAPADNCAQATPISNGLHPFSTVGATTDGPNEPNACNFFGYTQVGNDIWYRYTSQCVGAVVLTLCDSSYDAKVAVYDANCPAASAAIACNDDACTFGNPLGSRTGFFTTPGSHHLIRIGGYQSSTGAGVLAIYCKTCPTDVNDDEWVNVTDLLAIINAWGPCPGCVADVNFDNVVNVTDLLAVINAWGFCPAS